MVNVFANRVPNWPFLNGKVVVFTSFTCVCVRVRVVDWYLHMWVSECGRVLPGWAQSIHLHFGKGSRFTFQAVKFSVFKVLCQGLSLGSLLSPGWLPTVVHL